MNADPQITAIILLTLLIVFRNKFPKYKTNWETTPVSLGIAIISVALTIVENSKYMYISMLAIALFCELYVYFQLPYSKYFWKNFENASNPKYRKIRLFSFFIVSPLMGVPLFYYLFILFIDDIAHFFSTSSDERKQILGKQLPLYAKYGVKGLFLYAIIAAILLIAAKYGTEFLSRYV